MKSFFPFCALPEGGASEDCCARATGIPNRNAATKKRIATTNRFDAPSRLAFDFIRGTAPVSARRSAQLITRISFSSSSAFFIEAA
jgi:hypothetical protein